MKEQMKPEGDQANSLRKVVIVKAPLEVAWRVFTEKMGTWWPLATHKIGQAKAAGVAYSSPSPARLPPRQARENQRSSAGDVELRRHRGHARRPAADLELLRQRVLPSPIVGEISINILAPVHYR